MQFARAKPTSLGDTRPTHDILGTQGFPYIGTPSNATGTVDMQQSINWLRQYGYTFRRGY
jgi:hypothetical protein